MKKQFACFFVTAAVLFSLMTCFAGSIPEDLLAGEHCQVFFGEVKHIDGTQITVIPTQKVKGEFEQGRERTYPEFAFTPAPAVGQTYLMGYVDANNPLYVWEVTGTDPRTLKIKNDNDMSRRMQAYLNEGKFEQQEAERLAVSGAAPDQETGAAEQDEAWTFPILPVSLAVLAVLCACFVFFLVRRRNR